MTAARGPRADRVRDGWRFWLGVAVLMPVAVVLWLRDAALAALTDHPRTRSEDGHDD